MTDPFQDLLQELGVLRRGHPVLARPARHFDLPAGRERAASILTDLTRALDRICRARPFPKGSGIAAPQLGVSMAAAIVRPRGMSDLALLNPRVVDRSEELDVQWEGCLSFFELRGRVSRPRVVTVRWETLSGQVIEQRFHDGAARMVAHECDHLEGVLYLERLTAGTQPVCLDEYPDAQQPWRN